MCFFFLRWRESSTSSKECHCRGEIRFICYLLAFDASPWFGKAFRTSFPLDKIWHILALWQTQFLSKSCEEVIPNSTCPSPSSTDWMFHIALGEFKSGDGCSCDLKLLYHRGWWYNHSSKDRFLNLSVSIILGFASPKKSGRMCRLPLAHYTKQWNCLFLLCLLGFFTQSSPSHDAVLWFHFVGRLSYPIRKKPVEMTEVRMERCFAMPALAMVEVLHTLNGPPGYFSKWIPMDSSEFAWGLQPWSGMGTVPGEALWVFLLLLRFLMCKRKQVKVRKSTLLQNPQPSPPWCWIIPIDIAKPQLLQTCRRMSGRRSCLNPVGNDGVLWGTPAYNTSQNMIAGLDLMVPTNKSDGCFS